MAGTDSAQERRMLNRSLAQMLKGGVIMDVTTPEQARVAEDAGACAVMALERIPADIRAAGGVSPHERPRHDQGHPSRPSASPSWRSAASGTSRRRRSSRPSRSTTSTRAEVLSPADDVYHIDKTRFAVPFVCGARDLGEALRRIAEGATMIRTKGEPGTGDVVQAVRHMRLMHDARSARVAGLRRRRAVRGGEAACRCPWSCCARCTRRVRSPW